MPRTVLGTVEDAFSSYEAQLRQVRRYIGSQPFHLFDYPGGESFHFDGEGNVRRAAEGVDRGPVGAHAAARRYHEMLEIHTFPGRTLTQACVQDALHEDIGRRVDEIVREARSGGLPLDERHRPVAPLREPLHFL